MKYVSIVLLINCAVFLTNCGQVRSDNLSKKIFLRNEIEQDFNEITNIIETKVPSPFYNCPKEKYDSVKQHIQANIPNSAGLSDLYKLFYPLVQTLNDAHFSLHFPDNYFANTTKYFPFKIIIPRDKIFVKENLSDEKSIGKGNEVISINSIPAENIITTIRSCNFKSSSEELFFEKWNEGVFYKRLFTLFNLSDTFNITLSNGKSLKIIGISEQLLKHSTNNDDKPIFKLLNNQIGYLKIPLLVWNQNADRESFDKSIDSVFTVLQSIKGNKLIIDIRDNPGGSSILAKDILDYIYFKPYTLSNGEVDMEKGVIKEALDTGLHTPAFHANKFTGKTILLNNVLTYSSAHMMQVGFKYYQMGQTIGEISSEPLFITGEVNNLGLKNSNLQFYFPTSNFILPGFEKRKKTYYTPVVTYTPTLAERLSDQDIFLEKAKNLFDK